MTDSVPWTCPTCHENVATPFCARCGEEPLAPRDLTLRGLIEKLVHALTSIDARAVRTFKRLIREPGELTLAWTRGVRKAYVAPFQLFLIANVFFFAFQSLSGVAVFSSSLDSHLHHQDWSALAQSLLAQRLDATHRTLAEFEPLFNRAVVLNAKSLIVIMAMVFALFLPLAFLRERRPFMAHVVFAVHLYTFLLLLFCVAIVLTTLSALLGMGGLESRAVDNVISIAILAACTWHLYAAIGPAYRAAGASRIGQAAALAVVVAAIVLGYRFLLFVITLFAT